jgi:hypothetical protein
VRCACSTRASCPTALVLTVKKMFNIQDLNCLPLLTDPDMTHDTTWHKVAGSRFGATSEVPPWPLGLLRSTWAYLAWAKWTHVVRRARRAQCCGSRGPGVISRRVWSDMIVVQSHFQVHPVSDRNLHLVRTVLCSGTRPVVHPPHDGLLQSEEPNSTHRRQA